jgi:hypothetical protein
MRRSAATVALILATCLGTVMLGEAVSASRADPGHDGGSRHGRGADIAALHALQASFHHAVSGGGRIDELTGLWAPDATFTAGGNVIVGRDAIRTFFLSSAGFQHPTWVSLAPSFKTRIDVHGKQADLYFECHFVDLATGMLVAPPPAFAGGTFVGTAVKRHGHWYFKDVTAGNAPLTA